MRSEWENKGVSDYKLKFNGKVKDAVKNLSFCFSDFQSRHNKAERKYYLSESKEKEMQEMLKIHRTCR